MYEIILSNIIVDINADEQLIPTNQLGDTAKDFC